MTAISRAVHQNRALAEIDIQNGINIALYDAMVAQKISNRTIAITGCAFGGEHRLIHAELPAGEPAEHRQDAAECILPFGIEDQT
jgi:hypothetical protein